jgi:hypothetical protein
MPAVQTFTVTRTQSVTVRSTSSIGAAAAALKYLEGDESSSELGVIITEGDRTDLLVRQES